MRPDGSIQAYIDPRTVHDGRRFYIDNEGRRDVGHGRNP